MATSPTPVSPRPAGLPRELLSSTGFLLKRLGFALKERAHEALQPTGLSPQHHAVLTLVEEGACSAQGAIADVLGYDRSQLVGLLDELEEQRLIERRRDPADRRRHVVQMTPAGRKTLARLRALSQKLEREFLAPLDEAERAELHALLLRLAGDHIPACRGVVR